MHGSAMHETQRFDMKIFGGGGGSTYTPELSDGLLRAGMLGLQEIWLVDPNQSGWCRRSKPTRC